MLNFQAHAHGVIMRTIPRIFAMTTFVLNIASSLALSLGSSPQGESAADNAKRLQLEGFRSHDFHLLLGMTVLVAIGVIMEGPEIIQEARNAWFQCRARRVRRRSIAPWITLIGALGWLLVAVGVAGEGYWEMQVSHDDVAITSFDEGKLGEAEITAGAANERAGKLEAANISLQNEVGAARREADLSELDAASARKEAAVAENDRASALERTKRLEAGLSWRTVAPEQRSKLRTLLASSTRLLMPLAGLKINITYLNSDAEAQEYADELKDALDGLGAEIAGPSGVMMIGGPGFRIPEGVILTANPFRNRLVNSLIISLNGAGIPVSGVRDGNMNEHDFSILVGAKPHNPSP